MKHPMAVRADNGQLTQIRVLLMVTFTKWDQVVNLTVAHTEFPEYHSEIEAADLASKRSFLAQHSLHLGIPERNTALAAKVVFQLETSSF